ncbi:MAG: RNA polymerase sigma factor [Tepidisphaeraceae bacterium]
MVETDERALICRAAAGDNIALAVLVRRYEPTLLAYAQRRHPPAVHSTISPEDIVQETLYEACRMIPSFVAQGTDAFYHWLLRIANLRIKAAIRKYRGRRTYAVSDRLGDEESVLQALEQLRVYRRSPSASAAGHEFVATVERSLTLLNDSYRKVILHRYIDGLSIDETASRMNSDVGKIYVLTSRALKALRLNLASLSHYC